MTDARTKAAQEVARSTRAYELHSGIVRMAHRVALSEFRSGLLSSDRTALMSGKDYAGHQRAARRQVKAMERLTEALLKMAVRR